MARNKRLRKKVHIPAVMQIRLGGAKGMLSVDTRLKGRAVCRRPSMIKFTSESPSSEIEIAGTFTKPRKMFLNRPLIMLLGGLGVETHVFLQLQRNTVEQTISAAKDIGATASLIEALGLGSAFHLPSVLHSLKNLQLDFAYDANSMLTPFWMRILDGFVHHALRELKSHARIPLPGSWTLIGVADVYEELQEGEIFACILDADDGEPKYLEGPCLITRSPVIHPGDVQKVRAVGRPRPESPYAAEPLANAVVFSVLGMGLDHHIYSQWSNRAYREALTSFLFRGWRSRRRRVQSYHASGSSPAALSYSCEVRTD
jgi:RNA-dependent RNA polymerase